MALLILPDGKVQSNKWTVARHWREEHVFDLKDAPHLLRAPDVLESACGIRLDRGASWVVAFDHPMPMFCEGCRQAIFREAGMGAVEPERGADWGATDVREWNATRLTRDVGQP